MAKVAQALPYGARVGMEPVAVLMRLVTLRDGAEHEISFDPRAGRQSARFAEVACALDDESIALSIEPAEPMRIISCLLELRHAFASDEMVLLNGYQSWTDTVERPAWARMRGLRGVPVALVDRFAIDGGGDYRFCEYDGIPGHQHGFTYATFRRGEGMVLLGSLDERRGFTEISIDASQGRVLLEPECPASSLDARSSVELGRFVIVRGAEDACYDRYFELAGIAARPAPRLVGYSSWYRHYGEIDEPKLASDLSGAAAFLGPLAEEIHEAGEGASDISHAGAAGAGCALTPQLLFQIDDGYCKVGDWLDVDARKFPHGLAPLAQAARDAGFLPGLWVAPFVCERDSRIFAERSEWLLRDESGNLVTTGPQWSGGFALDTRNVDVRTYVLEAVGTMVEEWGFALLKADFLYAACMVSHDGLNRGELMADALALLRTAAGQDCLILGCGVPLGSAFGILDYCRIGCDVGLDWDGPLHMRALHRERVSTKNSLANTYGRAPLDGRAFGNDPDVFFLRDDVALSSDQRDELLFADADLGSVFLTSDDMGAWDERQRNRYHEALRIFLKRR